MILFSIAFNCIAWKPRWVFHFFLFFVSVKAWYYHKYVMLRLVGFDIELKRIFSGPVDRHRAFLFCNFCKAAEWLSRVLCKLSTFRTSRLVVIVLFFISFIMTGWKIKSVRLSLQKHRISEREMLSNIGCSWMVKSVQLFSIWADNIDVLPRISSVWSSG